MEQGDWHLIVEEDIGPAPENKALSSALSEESDVNLQFMEASVTEPFLQENDEGPPTASEINEAPEEAAPAASNDLLNDENTSDSAVESSQPGSKRAKPTKTATVKPALAAIAVIVLLAGCVLASSFIYASYARNSDNFIVNSPSSILLRPPSCSLPSSTTATSGNSRDAPRLTDGTNSQEKNGNTNFNQEINARIDHLEAQVLSVSHLLTHHDVRLTKLESQVTELTDMVLKFSSCGAHFYKTKPEFDFSKAVDGQKNSESLFVEGRTKICVDGRTSKDLIHASPKCRQKINGNCVQKNEILAEKKNASSGDGGGGDGKESNEGTADSRTIKTDIDELRDRIAAVEHGMDAMHSLLSTSNDDVDRELAALSATMARLQEKVEELGDR